MNIEKEVGSIEIGKRADMIVLDKNLFDIPPDAIDSLKVLLTVFEGDVVYDASSDPTGEEAIEERYGVELDLTGETGHPCCEWHKTHSHEKQ
jgi:urease alpha subunit